MGSQVQVSPQHPGPKALCLNWGGQRLAISWRAFQKLEGSPHPLGEGAPSLVFSAEDPESGGRGH